MFCKHCGQRIGPDDMFCARCGQAISQEEFETDVSHAPHPNPAPANAAAAPVHRSWAPSILDLEPENGNAVTEIAPASLPPVEEKPGAPASRVPRYVASRKRSFPVIEALVAVLLVAGAIAAIWIFRSTVQPRPLPEPASPLVTISPASAKLGPGKSAEFTATVSGDQDNEISWSVEEKDLGGRVVPKGAKAEAGQVHSLAIYTAPRKAGVYHLRASSTSKPMSSATALITVQK